MRVNELCKIAHKIAREKGFWGGFAEDLKTQKSFYVYLRNQGELIALMHSELSEALEALRQEDKSKNNVGEELADCCIRIFDYCEAYDIDLEKAINDKIKINRNRPKKHGKNF